MQPGELLASISGCGVRTLKKGSRRVAETTGVLHSRPGALRTTDDIIAQFRRGVK